MNSTPATTETELTFTRFAPNEHWLGEIKVRTFENEQNIEIQRILIERYGLDNFLVRSIARKIQEDDRGVLYQKDDHGDGPLLAVKVLNSTPKPDGSFKTYFLRVPPHIRSTKEGVARTFNLNKDENAPDVES